MRRRVILLATALVVVAAVVAWREWARDPGPTAPGLTARELVVADRHIEGDVTLLGGGSHAEAHRLWDRYHDQPAVQGVRPRLLGVSLVHIASEPDSSTPTGDYWIVFRDRAWQPNLGGKGGAPGWYSREVVLVAAGGGTTSGNIMLF
jgi:hypothetical protein